MGSLSKRRKHRKRERDRGKNKEEKSPPGIIRAEASVKRKNEKLLTRTN